MTLCCCCCRRNFSPVLPRPYPEFPGYCDQCGELEKETRPTGKLEETIHNLKIGGSAFFPVTDQDPRPWETVRAEIGRPRWALLSLCVHRVQKDDPYLATCDGRELVAFESQDGARLFKNLTFEDLELGVEFASAL